MLMEKAGGAPPSEGGNQPNMLQTMMRCVDIMTSERAVRDCLLADVVIRPRFEITGWKSFDQADAYADAGYAAAQEILPAIQKLLPWLDRSRERD